MQGALWTHYIDNDGALAALIKGSSSVTSGDVIIGRTWRLISHWEVSPWFERVCSASNPLDGLSRGRRNGPWKKVIDFSFDQSFIDELESHGSR